MVLEIVFNLRGPNLLLLPEPVAWHAERSENGLVRWCRSSRFANLSTPFGSESKRPGVE